MKDLFKKILIDTVEGTSHLETKPRETSQIIENYTMLESILMHNLE